MANYSDSDEDNDMFPKNENISLNLIREYEIACAKVERNKIKVDRLRSENSKLKRDIQLLDTKMLNMITQMEGGDEIKLLKKEISELVKERDKYLMQFKETDKKNDQLYKRIHEQEKLLMTLSDVDDLKRKIKLLKEEIKDKNDENNELIKNINILEDKNFKNSLKQVKKNNKNMTTFL